ncbi:DUF5462 family protein [Vibrio mediterranei]|uniref:DUF5462 family protein n=2 Tax=Vibrio mediterranei TaxID=689 RepID=UPI0038CF0C10|nr:DUF5462 family protein [Vibrio mediterranei]
MTNMRLFFLLLMILVGYLFSYTAAAEGTTKYVRNQSLGLVNGVVNNDRLQIEKTLEDPVLLSVNDADLDGELKYLRIANATLLKNHRGEVLVKVTSSTGSDVATFANVELIADERKVSINGKQVGDTVEITALPRFKNIKLKINQAIKITMPKSYRGGIEFAIEVEGVG